MHSQIPQNPKWVEIPSGGGSFLIQECPMPRIDDQFLQTAVYLYKDRKDAKENANAGASGFVVYHESTHFTGMPYYIATNAHVIRDGFSVIRINKKSEGYDVLESHPAMWLEHPDGDDLAICPIMLFPDHDFNFVRDTGCVDEDKLRQFNIGVGDEVFMVGRFIYHSGERRNIPIARFGNIAMMPLEEIENGIGKKRKHFLVEVRSVSGFSGSPVFVYDVPTSPSLDNVRPERFTSLLLGIDCGHSPKREKQLSAGIAAVVPAWRLVELLEHPKMKRMREEKEIEVKKEMEESRRIIPDASCH